MDKEMLSDLFDRLEDLHVVVVGDVMLDCYWWGDVERISPESPVPVVTIRRREQRLGGAANVALNCRALGAKVVLAGVVGADKEGEQLIQLAGDAGIGTSLLLTSNKRPTTTKTRVISRNQQMLRVDDEMSDDLFVEEEHAFIDKVLRYLQIEKPQVLIFEDYNKGVLKENVIQRIITHCRELGIVTAVDPKNKNFLAYKGVTLFKPNLKEVREGLKIALEKTDQPYLDIVHDELQNTLKHSITLITLSDKGVYCSDGKSRIVPAHVRNIADVSGAGDTVIAVASLFYTLSKDVRLMAQAANLAGGLVCEEVGVVPINKDRLRQECELLLAE